MWRMTISCVLALFLYESQPKLQECSPWDVHLPLRLATGEIRKMDPIRGEMFIGNVRFMTKPEDGIIQRLRNYARTQPLGLHTTFDLRLLERKLGVEYPSGFAINGRVAPQQTNAEGYINFVFGIDGQITGLTMYIPDKCLASKIDYLTNVEKLQLMFTLPHGT